MGLAGKLARKLTLDKVGTRSVLFGAHCFLIHPWFVAAAWTKLYGFPRDPRLWLSFALHDIGYLGKANMDGEEGETHPYVGAGIVSALFDDPEPNRRPSIVKRALDRAFGRGAPGGMSWFSFNLYHSRFLAKRHGKTRYSMLCVADKLSICLTPA